MSEKDFAETFGRKLKYFLDLYDMSQFDLSKRLEVSTTSVSNWVNGLKAPRMSKVDAMCDIFHCTRSDFMNDEHDQEGANKVYYTNPETAQIAQEILDSKELSALFDVSRNMSPDDLQTVYQMALALYRKDHGAD